MEVQKILDRLKTLIGNPSDGLPEEVFRFVTSITPMVNVDLLIKDERRRTLLTWREDGFYPPSWHIPGGIVRHKETLRDRIVAVAKSELGVEVAFQAEPLAMNEVVYPQGTIRSHFISFLYECTLVGSLDDALRYDGKGKPRAGEWAWHEQCPDNLIPVHEMYREFL